MADGVGARPSVIAEDGARRSARLDTAVARSGATIQDGWQTSVSQQHAQQEQEQQQQEQEQPEPRAEAEQLIVAQQEQQLDDEKKVRCAQVAVSVLANN